MLFHRHDREQGVNTEPDSFQDIKNQTGRGVRLFFGLTFVGLTESLELLTGKLAVLGGCQWLINWQLLYR